jgi:hypothetical protein
LPRHDILAGLASPNKSRFFVEHCLRIKLIEQFKLSLCFVISTVPTHADYRDLLIPSDILFDRLSWAAGASAGWIPSKTKPISRRTLFMRRFLPLLDIGVQKVFTSERQINRSQSGVILSRNPQRRFSTRMSTVTSEILTSMNRRSLRLGCSSSANRASSPADCAHAARSRHRVRGMRLSIASRTRVFCGFSIVAQLIAVRDSGSQGLLDVT